MEFEPWQCGPAEPTMLASKKMDPFIYSSRIVHGIVLHPVRIREMFYFYIFLISVLNVKNLKAIFMTTLSEY